MALSPEELDGNLQTYAEFRAQVDREIYGLNGELSLPSETAKTEPPRTVFVKPVKPPETPKPIPSHP